MASQEDQMMAEARRLIQERDLSSASKILTEVVLANPERLDETEELRAEINRLSNERLARLQELVRNLNEEKDFERVLELIDEIAALDKSENTFSQELLEDLEFTAIITVSRERFQEIMAQGLELLAAESYGLAIENYLRGFDLRREEFLEADYPQFLKNTVNANLGIMIERANQFIEDESAYLQTLALGRQLINLSAPSELRGDFASLFARMQELASLRRSIEDAVQVFEGQAEILNQTRDQDPFLGFSTLVVRGRVRQAEEGVKEGIIGTFDLIWERILDNWTEALKANATEIWQGALVQWQGQEYEESLVSFQDLANVADLGQRITALWRDYLDWEEDFQFSARSWEILLEQLAPYKEWQTIEDTATLLAQTSELNLELQGLEVETLTDDEILLAGEQWRSNQATLEEFLDTIRTQKEISPTLELAYGLDLSGLDDWTDPAATLISRAVDESQEIQVALRREIASRAWNPLLASSAERDLRWEEIQTLSVGVEVDGDRRFFPNRVLAIANAEDPLWQDLISGIEDFIQITNQEEDYILEDQTISALLDQALLLLPDRREVYQAFSSLRQFNQERLDQARALAAEANSILVQIRADLQSPGFSDYEGADEDLQQAEEIFTQSSVLQYDPEAELTYQNARDELSTIIQNGRQQAVQAFAATSVQRARSFYTNGAFRDAMDVLDIANERWDIVFRNTINPSLSNLTTLVSRALRASSGRVVEPTDPLYNEVQQLLTLAESNYLMAQRSSGAQREEYAKQAELTLTRLRAIFPLNQQASLLQLKINQLTESPADFRQTLQNKFTNALRLLNPTEPGQEPDPERAISELEDLQIVDPQFPRIDQAIFDAKVVAGLIIPPVPQAERNRSNALAVRARTILQNATSQSELNQAQSLNNQAITIWPENPTANANIGPIAVALNTGIRTVLTTLDNRRLNQAIDFIRERSYTRAQLIVDDLWSVQANRGVQRLIDTRQRLALATQNL
jgi:hypothetical protein